MRELQDHLAGGLVSCQGGHEGGRKGGREILSSMNGPRQFLRRRRVGGAEGQRYTIANHKLRSRATSHRGSVTGIASLTLQGSKCEN